MKKVILIPSNTDLNRGDQALVWESIRIIEDVFGKKNVAISLIETGSDENSRCRQNRQTKKLGYDFIRPILKHPARIFSSKEKIHYSFITLFLWGFRASFDYVITRMLLSQYVLLNKIGSVFLDNNEKKTMDLFKECDYVFVKGGGFCIHMVK